MAGEGEGREGGEGPSEKADFAEYVEYLKEKYPEGGIKDEDSAGRPHEKESEQSEESAEGSGRRARGNHAEQPEETEVKEGGAGRLEAEDEGGRDEELERLLERIKEILESQAAEEKHDLDQERRNPGNGPVEERARDDARGEPQTLGERLGRESEPAQQPESGGRGERAEENRADWVLGDHDRRGEPHQDPKLDRPLPTERLETRERSEASSEIEGKPGVSRESERQYQPDVVRESKGLMDSSDVSERSEPSRKVQADGVREAGAQNLISSKLFDIEATVDSNAELGRASAFEHGHVRKDESESHDDASLARRESRENDAAILASAGLQNSDPLSIRFQILKRDLEERTGMKIEPDRLYEIKGKVEGVFDFEVCRTVSNYFRVFVPVEYQPRVQLHRVYDVRITSVKEVHLTEGQREILQDWSRRGVPWNRITYRINHMKMVEPVQRNEKKESEKVTEMRKNAVEAEKPQKLENLNVTFTLDAYRYSRTSPRIYFHIRNSSFERSTGMKIEEGTSYLIKGKVEGVGNFQKTLRSLAASQDVVIYVPIGLVNRLEAGKKYQVTIDSIEKLPSKRDSWQGRESIDITGWTWRDVAAWVDTEGCIYTEKIGKYFLTVTQKERRVLQELCAFLDKQGIQSKLRLQKTTGVYHIEVLGTDQIAKTIKNIEPYIRTEKKKEQIVQFKDKLMEPRKSLRPGIRIARETLGLTEN